MKFYILLITSLIFYTCKSDPNMPARQHTHSFGDSILKKFNPNGTNRTMINACELFTSDWDSIIVVPAYAGYGRLSDKFDFKNMKAVKIGINNTMYRDDITTLLFILKDSITQYEQLLNMPVYFSSLVETTNTNFPVLKKDSCTTFFLNKVNVKNEVEYRASFK